MGIPKATFSKLIKEFKLKELFNELGWDNATAKYPINVDGKLYSLTGIAQKKEFLILLCQPQNGNGIPDAAARKKIDNQITKLHYEHLIIYVDGKKTRQRWELMIREQNKPVVCRPIDYFAGQEPELLFQKLEGLFFSYDDEEKLSIVDVRSRVMANFEKNAEVVTKKFYERFSKEHEKFLSFINGIQSKVDQEWYASLMLNRLMFIYFIQKKGFLDKERDYLRNRLDAVQKKKGKNKFYSFYRDFLLILFHKGLGSPLHDSKFVEDFGKVPYLNGGLFDVHKLEEENKNISIEDKAFERIFDFFDEYNWHLDTRVTATGKDINPDVIGYIFEKYINDRAAMGAYYTKEDITEYISKNCIVPWLFDEVKRNYAKPFAHVGAIRESPLQGNIWSFLQQSGDRYIYPAVKHGIQPNTTEENGFDDLPEDVRSCIDPNTPDLVEKRKCWNRLAPSDIALPTEIYREVIARRKRYYEVRNKIQAGEITEINDFITYNLDIRQFAQDVLEKTDDPKLIMEFYKAVRKITVLDPTCGSGAFLFAALNVLEPLYFACVTRMREFVEEHGKGKHKFFEDELKLIDSDDHPNEEYFIYKSIILHNLYDVDIMKEAVEIAKLRLFLKLVATCDVDYKKPNLGLEPLPDIDFNIRSGNTLVGYATLADLDKGEQGGLFGDEEKEAILEEADVVSRAYARFKDAQLVMHSRQKDGGQADPKQYKDAKDELNNRLTILNEKLARHMTVESSHDKWVKSHQPFHWLAEFYTIMNEAKGFDIIIGNPPYISISKIGYSLSQIGINAGDLYGYVIARCLSLLNERGKFSFIVMHSLAFSWHFTEVREKLQNEAADLWFSFFARIPAGLFSGDVRVRNCIFLLHRTKNQTKTTCTTRIHRWKAEERPWLIPSLQYAKFTFSDVIPMFNDETEAKFFENLDGELVQTKFAKHSKHKLYFKQNAYNWICIATSSPPSFSTSNKPIPQTQIADIALRDEETQRILLLLFAGKLFFAYWLVYGDEFHTTQDLFQSFSFPFTKVSPPDLSQLLNLSKDFESELPRTVQFKLNAGKRVGTYNTAKLWHLTDQSDAIFLKYLTKEPKRVFENIQRHVDETIKTVSESTDEE